jgi:hypothetical protein
MIVAGILVATLLLAVAGVGAYLRFGVSHGRWASIQHPCSLLRARTVMDMGMDGTPRTEDTGRDAVCEWPAQAVTQSDSLDLNLHTFDSTFFTSAEDNARSFFQSRNANDPSYAPGPGGLGDQAVGRHDSASDEFVVRSGNVVWDLSLSGHSDPSHVLGAAREVDGNLQAGRDGE